MRKYVTSIECDEKIIKLDSSSFGERNNLPLGSPGTGYEEFPFLLIRQK